VVSRLIPQVELPAFFTYNQRMAKEALYEIIVNNLPYGFMAVDRHGLIVDFNHAAEQITGFSRDEVLGKSHVEIFHGGSPTQECPLWRHAFEHQHKMLAVEHVITKKNGETAVLSVGIAPLIDKDGSFVGGIELLRDITELKKKERERKNILSMFAHDMKNSVLIASGFVARLENEREGALTEIQRADLDTVRQELNQLEKLIFDFLQFSRFEAEEYKPSLSPFDICDVLKHAVESVRCEAESKHQTLTFVAEESACITINADAEMLKRAIINLLDNAIKYTPAQGKITVHLRLTPGAISLQVTDSGVGIAPDQLPLIFDAFYRADKTTKGSGLGLFIVKTIVNAHGGKVDVKSSPGQGSTFTIILPR